jgi:hypothetical protein
VGVSASVSGGGGVVEGGAEGPLQRDGVEELRSAFADAVVEGVVIIYSHVAGHLQFKQHFCAIEGIPPYYFIY